MDSKNSISRRDFLRYAGALGLAVTAQGLVSQEAQAAATPQVASNGFSSIFNNKRDLDLFNARFDAKGLPVTTISDTGVIIPRMGLGCGSRFSALALNDYDAAVEMLSYALDKGFYYWDTAPIYSGVDRATGRTVYSEDVLGEVVKYRRNEILLNSKMVTRDPDEFEASLETTLRKLNTDYLDMMMVHGVTTMDELNVILKADVIDRMLKLKEQGVFRIFGFSAHSDAAPIKALIDMGCFQNSLIAMNEYRASNDGGERQDMVPYAYENKVGVMLIKTVRSYERKPEMNISAEDGIRMGLELEGATGPMVGMDSNDIVDANVKILQDYKDVL